MPNGVETTELAFGEHGVIVIIGVITIRRTGRFTALE